MAALTAVSAVSGSSWATGEPSWCSRNGQLQQYFNLDLPCNSRPSLKSSKQRMSIVNTVSNVRVAEQRTAEPVSRKTYVTVEAIVTIRKQPGNIFKDMFTKAIDSFLSETLEHDMILQLVSTEVDPSTGSGKRSKESSALRKSTAGQDTIHYVTEFRVDHDFGTPGAIFMANKREAEFFLETISLEGLPGGPVSFACYSWVHSQEKQYSKRVFFYNEAFLPSSTPPGLKDIRTSELQTLQGTGKGVRKPWDRVYDYDRYNDLGNPDKAKSLARPPAGGSALPYPRRCRTGRAPSKSDPLSESRLDVTKKNYVPRDEDFEQIKSDAFSSGRLRAIVHRLVPTIVTHFTQTPDEFDSFTDIDRLYYEGIQLKSDLADQTISPGLWNVLPEAIKKMINGDGLATALKYPLPTIVEKDKFAWIRDSEFARQMLAGLNPLKIERLKEFPPVSTLDEKVYGPLKSAFRAEEIEKYLDGLSVEKAMELNRLFILDYHDVFLPLVNKINSLEGRKCYATRTIFFLDSEVLRPVGIELSLPLSKDKPNGSKRVFYPSHDATAFWLWQLAKTHVSSDHSAYHQVVTHWLQTHACTEAYVIAANRQLSAMHPVAKLIDPHFRYTMEINATARQTLISANGVIENCFTPGRYGLELSSAGYRTWQFGKQGLPADLLERGMAVKDNESPHGLKLLIEDYPYAADGLLIWSAIESWIDTYLSIYYDEPDSIMQDTELQAWWNEIKTKGHPDKKDGWPKLETKEDLTEILTSMIWVASGQHAAVNFGQFLYSGYVPNMPALTRKLIPEEGDPEYRDFLSRPQHFLLATLPNQVQATTVMAVLELLSTHHPDEEYLGQRVQTSWTNNEAALEAAKKFEDKTLEIQNVIMERNRDPKLKNRQGAGIPPYELLLPYSGPGVTARGVPNSVSI